MRHANISSGFVICWFLNMFLNWEVGALALLFWVAAEWFGLSVYPAIVTFGIWVGGAFLITCVFAWAGSGSRTLRQNEELPNVNPYSINPYKRDSNEDK